MSPQSLVKLYLTSPQPKLHTPPILCHNSNIFLVSNLLIPRHHMQVLPITKLELWANYTISYWLSSPHSSLHRYQFHSTKITPSSRTPTPAASNS